MLTVSEVKTNREIKEFINFPLKLYKDSPYFVPPLYSEEKKLLKAGGKPEIADSVFFLAKRDGKVVGRIQGILQKQYNEIHNDKRIRFTRFDSIDDKEVSRALFSAVEQWGREKGMTQVCGPLGYSDLEREGLLVWGFDENSTFEEQYNFEYYQHLVEDSGYVKEVDWNEFELTAPEQKNQMLERVAKRSLELNGLHLADTNMPKKAYINKYADSFFECLDACYSKLYGTVPISKEERKELIGEFYTIMNTKFLVFICDENERVVAFGLCFPSIGDALKKSRGRLTLPALIKILRTVKNPTTVDFGLIAVRPEYQNSGVNAVLVNGIVDFLMTGAVKKFETNLILETNTAARTQWKYCSSREHKRRRSYVKTIANDIAEEKDNA